MDDLFQRLEHKLLALIHKYQQSKAHNLNLAHSQGALSHDKELLIAKNKVVISRIESMILRLKWIEK